MADTNEPYRVLARKYRPQNFDELVGQDALVRTLQNAITSGRIAHAFMLTGVRGVGKTTTARIIAKALNYKGPDGTSGPTTGDTSNCGLCQAISEDRHPDVIEMDAASRTGVDDIREILDGVRYAPTEARYKIYVIDEVHMLSKNAFNALLKTLEEPPEHVKFIFATTEIRKVPITVLSRCQRFDLQRIHIDLLADHFKSICGKEDVQAEDEAITMIARAADGSARDGLSLLDQAIALAGDKITTEQVQDMLGLADRAQNLDLLEKALTADMPGALSIMDSIHKNGGTPSVVIQDLLDLTHVLTKLRAAPNLEDANQTLSGDQLERAREMAQKISMPSLSKTWQILLKGLGEINTAPNPQSAAEMVLIRLAYAANLPDPADLIKKLKNTSTSDNSTTPTPAPSSGANTGGMVHAQNFSPPQAQTIHAPNGGGGQETARLIESPGPMLSVVETPAPLQTLANIKDVVTLLEQHEEYLIASQLYHFAHPVKLEHKNHAENPTGRFEFRPQAEAMPELSQNLSKALKAITGQPWMIVVSQDRGQQTLHEIDEAKRLQELEDVSKLAVVNNILTIFPEATLVEIVAKKQDQPNKENT